MRPVPDSPQRAPRGLPLPLAYLRLARVDWARNRRTLRGGRRILVVRHPQRNPYFYELLLDWLASQHPELRALFELRPLPWLVRDWSRYALLVAWLQDPVQAWSKLAYRLALRLSQGCDRHGVAVVNRVERLANAGKSSGARLIAGAGFRTPRSELVTDAERFRDTRLGVPLPLFVREDWGHGGAMLRADSQAELRALPIERLARPVACELIDVKSPDGLFRKYRYTVAGDVGIRQSVHFQHHWVVRGTHSEWSEALCDEEIAFIRGPEPEHARFVAAREALGLDFVAFDYSVDRTGRLVVWEANPYPLLHFIDGRCSYRNAPTTRVLAAMARLYLERAGMGVPERLREQSETLGPPLAPE